MIKIVREDTNYEVVNLIKIVREDNKLKNKQVNESKETSDSVQVNYVIDQETYDTWKDQPILHDEDQWGGKYRTVGEMWEGEGYITPETSIKTESFDIDLASEEYFTKDELERVCQIVLDEINAYYSHESGWKFEIYQCISRKNKIQVEILSENGKFYDSRVELDLNDRKDLREYAKALVRDLANQIDPDFAMSLPLSKNESKVVKEANYDFGGAYDVDPQEYFTREDLIEFGDKVCDKLNEEFEGRTFELADITTRDTVNIYIEIQDNEYYSFGQEFKINFKRVQKPSDLDKYLDEVYSSFKTQFSELYNLLDFDLYDENDILDDESEWTELNSKQVEDSDGFMTDYTLYKNEVTGEFVTVFGDKDFYNPENSFYDFETDNEREAMEWFDDYNGFAEDFDIE